MRLVSNESFHWTSWIADMCPNFAVSNENFNWTQALPLWNKPFFLKGQWLSQTKIGELHFKLIFLLSLSLSLSLSPQLACGFKLQNLSLKELTPNYQNASYITCLAKPSTHKLLLHLLEGSANENHIAVKELTNEIMIRTYIQQ